MFKWISENPQLFGTVTTIVIFFLSFVGWLIRETMKLKITLKGHGDRLGSHDKTLRDHEVLLCEMKEDTKEITKEILVELKSLNTNYTNIAVSVGKLEGWVEAQKNPIK